MSRNGCTFTLNTLNSNDHIKHSKSFSYNRWYWQKPINEGTR